MNSFYYDLSSKTETHCRFFTEPLIYRNSSIVWILAPNCIDSVITKPFRKCYRIVTDCQNKTAYIVRHFESGNWTACHSVVAQFSDGRRGNYVAILIKSAKVHKFKKKKEAKLRSNQSQSQSIKNKRKGNFVRECVCVVRKKRRPSTNYPSEKEKKNNRCIFVQQCCFCVCRQPAKVKILL